MTIYNYYNYAKETAIGFLMDWVIEPTRKIFETLRHGENDDNMRIMSSESLKSDFDSLERMVVQFAKDQSGNLSQEQVELIGKNVRQGDLSVVLGAYEQDLKVRFYSRVKLALDMADTLNHAAVSAQIRYLGYACQNPPYSSTESQGRR